MQGRDQVDSAVEEVGESEATVEKRDGLLATMVPICRDDGQGV